MRALLRAIALSVVALVSPFVALSAFSSPTLTVTTGTSCDGIDFNNDGSVFVPCDIDSFLLVFSEGPCTPCGQ